MVTYSQELCNYFPANLYAGDSYAWECEVATFVRTSPQQSGPQREGEYQRLGMQSFLDERGIRVARHVAALGVDGRCVCHDLQELIEFAAAYRLPILGHDWERLCHRPHKLAKYHPVHFVSVLPLVPSEELPGLRTKARNRLFPDRKGGRPRAAIDPATVRDWERMGMSLRDIAKLTRVPKSTLNDLLQNCPKTP